MRHELGHVLDENSPAFPEFEEEIEHERIAWVNAKPKTPAENWYKNVSIRTHIDPLKMQSLGFPRPETKVSEKQLKQATNGLGNKTNEKEQRICGQNFGWKGSPLANLIENPTIISCNLGESC